MKMSQHSEGQVAWRGVEPDFIRPGKLVENAIIESFNAATRRLS